ncbi:amidohydrolase [Phytohabitans rumicis]|uniref:Amidohydrolase n=1 Tax=Phytohabitans rumicis TaxID=1076125 RepID=A0A6V8LG60_9ACTN|nr:amidohydrolase [Phytohabitans rumicis]GFJ96233.1 amidohydrolase [Phytohabitans rumicis]
MTRGDLDMGYADMGYELDRRQLLRGAAAVAAGTVAAGALPAGAAYAHGTSADLVIHNGRVLVLDERFRTAEAVAIRGGRVLAVGRARDVRRLVGRRTQVLDAGGGTVLPGINDSHVHLNALGLNFPPFSYGVDTATIDELVAVVRTAVEAASVPGSWIRGQGWNDNRLPRPPRRTDLDPVSGDHPVVLTDFSFHAMAVNTAALRLAGITRDTVPPPGGVIEKDADGEPTGVLRETAQGLVRAVVPAFTADEVARSIDAGVTLLHAQGITSVTDPGITLATLGLYADKVRAGTLGVRVSALLSGGTAPQQLRDVLAAYRPLRGIDPRVLRVAGVKLFADGIPTAAKTAWLHEPYLDGTNGSLVIDGTTVAEQVANLHEMIRVAVRAGFQVGTHATGDATIDAVVAGYLKAMGRDWRRADLRHYVIHADLTPRATLRTMARHDIGANMNATIKYLLGRTLDPVLGPARTDYQWPYRSALDLGVRVTSASDAPVTYPNWLQGVMAAALREGMVFGGAGGGVAGEAERITVPEALATYTRTPAWQDHAGGWKGTLAEGMVADVCVVGGDVLGVDPHELVNLPVTTTVVGGRVVYERSAGPVATTEAAAGHERGAACLRAGKCCCRLADELRA